LKFNIPKVVRVLSMADYAPEMAEAVIHVWVNPPREKVKVYYDLLADALVAQKAIAEGTKKIQELEEKGEPVEDVRADVNNSVERLTVAGNQIVAWMAEIWSQGSDPESRWTVEEIDRLIKDSRDTDPQLWAWLTARTRDLIIEHRSKQKKT